MRHEVRAAVLQDTSRLPYLFVFHIYREVYCQDVYFSSVIARRDNPLANEMSKWFVGLMSEMIDNI